MNCQLYPPVFSVSFSTPQVVVLRTSLLGTGGGLPPSRPVPPVPTTNARIPYSVSDRWEGDWGASRS